MAFKESISDKLARVLSPVMRKLQDVNVGEMVGTKVSLMRIIKTPINNMGDMEYTLETEIINNTILRYPLSEIELFDNIVNNNTETNTIDLWDILPIEMIVPFEGDDVETIKSIKKDDLFVDVLRDEHGTLIPIVLQVIRPIGAINVKYLVKRKYELSLFRGNLEQDIQDKINEYIGQPNLSSSTPSNGESNIDITSTITANFNIPMDETNGLDEITLLPATTFTTNWSDNKTLVITPSTDLVVDTDYILTLPKTMSSQAGHELYETKISFST